ncbi:MAG: ribosomal protein S18-alanine N-acetyltransferase [Candidatus Bathyarchaeia archaeon]
MFKLETYESSGKGDKAKASVLLRNVRPEDLREVIVLERLCFRKPFPSSYLGTLAYLSPKTFIVAELEGRIVGYVVASVRGKEGHIISIAVHPQQRRKGIGEGLLKKILSILLEEKVSAIILEVRRSNKAAISLYEKIGFRIEGVAKGYYSDGEDAFIMRYIPN